MRNYAIHAGWIISKEDGKKHWVPSGRLARLYRLRTNEYIIWNPIFEPYAADYIHLYPRLDGNYTLPVKELGMDVKIQYGTFQATPDGLVLKDKKGHVISDYMTVGNYLPGLNDEVVFLVDGKRALLLGAIRGVPITK